MSDTVRYRRTPREFMVAVFGAMIGVSAINHGIFEILQGWTAAPFPFIEAIGPAQRFWVHGAEGAFSIVPIFLLTGILVVLTALFTIYWSIARLHKKGSGPVFALCCLLLLLFGGGVAQVVFFGAIAVLLAIARRKPGTAAQGSVAEGKGKPILRLWQVFFAVGMLAFLLAMEIGIFGWFPLFKDADSILYTTFVSLGIGLAAYGAGFGAAKNARTQ